MGAARIRPTEKFSRLLSLGAIVPLVLASYSSSLVIMHFGPYGGRDDRERSDRR
jgi:hypothetical protein